MTTIFITIQGGVLQDISFIPPNTRIVVRDYDVDGVSSDEITRDDNGQECVESQWFNEDQP